MQFCKWHLIAAPLTVCNPWLTAAEEEKSQKLKKRLRAISREIQAVEDGLKSVNADLESQDADQTPRDSSMQHSNQRQGDLQCATMLERLSALQTKQTQLQVSCDCTRPLRNKVLAEATAERLQFCLCISFASKAK